MKATIILATLLVSSFIQANECPSFQFKIQPGKYVGETTTGDQCELNIKAINKKMSKDAAGEPCLRDYLDLEYKSAEYKYAKEIRNRGALDMVPFTDFESKHPELFPVIPEGGDHFFYSNVSSIGKYWGYAVKLIADKDGKPTNAIYASMNILFMYSRENCILK